MIETRPRIEFNASTLSRGYQTCRSAVQDNFGRFLWMFGNLPGERRNDLQALLYHLTKCIELLDLDSTNGLPLDAWSEIRDDLSDAFLDQYTSLPLMALVATCRKHRIPKQYLFDMLDGADTWIRFREFRTFDDLLVFAYRMGGAPTVAAVSILDFDRPGFEIPAIRAGQGVFLTFMLTNLVRDLKANRVFIAKQDIQQSGVVLNQIKLRHSSSEFEQLVRIYGLRIERLLSDGAPLSGYLEYDGRRSFRSLMSVCREILSTILTRPESLLNPSGVLAKKNWFTLRTRHLLGI